MHTYNLELYFPDIRENQNKDQNKTFKAFVKINEGENNLNFDFIADSSAPNIYNGQKGYYKYIGTDESVIIPESINGNVLKDYYKMFEENRVVNKVSSNSTKVTDMAFMFYKSEVTDLDLSSLNTSNVTNMLAMFSVSKVTNLDLRSFNTSNVVNMSSMFDGSFATDINLSSFNTSNVEDMSAMFSSSQIASIDLSSFDTSSVTEMSYMFSGSLATTGYARTQVDADRFNSSGDLPSG